MGEQPNQRRWNDQVSDLPAFYGNEKDTLSAESIVLRTEAAALALGWNDEATFNNFSLSLRAAAEKWLQMTKEIREDFLPRWSFIKPYFRATYGTKVDESKVLQIFAEMKQKPNEDPNNYAINFNENWRVIKEQFKLRPIDVPEDPAERTVLWCQNLYKKGATDNMADMQRLLFLAGMDKNLMPKVIQKDVPTFAAVLDQATRSYDLMHKDKDPPHNGIHQIDQTGLDDMSTDAEFVNQIQQGSNYRGNNRGNGYRGRSSSRGNSYRGGRGNSRGGYNNSGYSNNGNNSNGNNSGNSNNNQGQQAPASNPFKCLFCQAIGHHHDDCRKRIKANKPCVASSGKIYWPKPKVSRVEDKDNEEPQMQSAVKEHLFQ